jgi:tetratricopeptide (TPR) repeat protein
VPPLLTAALIVRDEAGALARCLASIRPVVDEIVVVDTGSQDDSPAVAEEYGAIVVHRPWDDDFAAARNAGLDRATGEWILYIDADEHLAPVDRDHVERELADRDRHVAYRVRLRALAGYTPYWEYRLWRNRPDVRFAGVIHETPLPDLERIAEAEHLTVGYADLVLDHDGYGGDQAAKHRRNLPLLEAEVRRRPHRTYLWNHLARIHLALGDDEAARANWDRAITVVRERGVDLPEDCLSYVDLVEHLARAGTPDAELAAEALRLFPEVPAVHWAAALDAVARGDHEAVIAHVDRVLDADLEAMARMALGVSEHLVTDEALHVRGVARLHLGDVDGAVADLREAERLDPEREDYRVKRLLAEARQAAG